MEEKKDRSLLTWQTKTICSFIAHSMPPSEDGAPNFLVDALDSITLDPKELDSISKDESDDNTSKRPVKYASEHAMTQFARGLMGGPMQAW